METVVHSIELSTGVTLQYVKKGNPSGIPLVLLHGFTDSWYSFAPVLPHLPDSVYAIALTQRGHGDASRPAAGYRYTDFAEDVESFMDNVGLGTAVIVGHSMGRAIAQRFAIDHPERTRGLVLIGAFSGEARNPVIAEFEESVLELTDPIDAKFVREFQESTLAQPVPPAFLEAVVRESLKVPARVWQAAFAGLLENDVASQSGEITVPALVISGDRDGFAPLDEVAVRALDIPKGRLAIYKGAGHGLHWEEPLRFATDLTAFAESLKNRSEPRNESS